jgi:hypothetical protein
LLRKRIEGKKKIAHIHLQNHYQHNNSNGRFAGILPLFFDAIFSRQDLSEAGTTTDRPTGFH